MNEVMTDYFPAYYKDFRCIADKCKDSCCLGWEIDIDDESYSRYRGMNTAFGRKIISNIAETDGTRHFVNDENKRCPFLCENGLCEMIIETGEDNLCQICSDHPRYYNYCGNIRLTGIGLCCEEAARLILTGDYTPESREINEEPLNDDDYSDALDEMFSILDDPWKIYGDGGISVKNGLDFLRQLDVSDPVYDYFPDYVEKVVTEVSPDTEYEIPCEKTVLENLIRYFVFRYFHEAYYDDDIMDFIYNSIDAVYIMMIWENMQNNGMTRLERNIHAARLYSCEVEYMV